MQSICLTRNQSNLHKHIGLIGFELILGVSVNYYGSFISCGYIILDNLPSGLSYNIAIRLWRDFAVPVSLLNIM